MGVIGFASMFDKILVLSPNTHSFRKFLLVFSIQAEILFLQTHIGGNGKVV